jgi:hypothetical protein
VVGPVAIFGQSKLLEIVWIVKSKEDHEGESGERERERIQKSEGDLRDQIKSNV